MNVAVASSSTAHHHHHHHVVHASSSAPTTIHIEDDDVMKITPLGSGNEVGRSAVLVEFKGKTVMFDCGIHPAYSGLASLPFFDEMDPSAVDLVLVTHFHLDHCGAVPYFLEKTTFTGRMFMTHPTKAIYKLLISDFVKVSETAPDEMLFNEQDLNRSLERIELIDYHQEMEHKGIKFWCYNAGHVLGAAMFMIEIAGVRVLYTGDFSRQSDRHLKGAETPTLSPHVLIVESTYGIQVHEPRREREDRFTQMVHEVVRRGGRVLLPVFALGRAQELLLILEEYWEKHYGELHTVPIYYASSLAKKSMSIFQTYINMMNESIREQFEVSNPFYFKHISNLKSIDDFHDTGPCVVMAAPGMLQSGLSRQLFDMWCSDPRNGVVISGYSVEGTLAKTITKEPPTVPLLNGMVVPLKMSVKTISFSAHSDREQTEEFVGSINPPHIVLVHGDSVNMAKLKMHLLQRFAPEHLEQAGAKPRLRVYTPKNCEAVGIAFKGEKTAKVMGSLAQRLPVEHQHVAGVLLHKDFQHSILAPQDLKSITDISCAGVKQRLLVPLSSTTQSVVAVDGLERTYLDKLKSLYQSVTVVQSQCKVKKEENGDVDLVKIKKEEDDDDVEMGSGSSTNGGSVAVVPSSTKPSHVAFSKEEERMIVYEVDSSVLVKIDPERSSEATIEWITSTTNDLVADSLCYLFMNSPAAVKEDGVDSMDEGIRDEAALLYAVQQILLDQFPDVDIDIDNKRLFVRGVKLYTPPQSTRAMIAAPDTATEAMSEAELEEPIIIDQFGRIMQCKDSRLRSRLEIMMKRVFLTLFPMPSLMGCLEDCCMEQCMNEHQHQSNGDESEQHSRHDI